MESKGALLLSRANGQKILVGEHLEIECCIKNSEHYSVVFRGLSPDIDLFVQHSNGRQTNIIEMGEISVRSEAKAKFKGFVVFYISAPKHIAIDREEIRKRKNLELLQGVNYG